MAETRWGHLVLTLSGSAQALTLPQKVRWVSLQPGAANANPVYIGGEGVSSTDYGTRIPVSSGSVPPPPHVIAEFSDGTTQLSDIYVLGTNTEKLHVHYLKFV
jgi:hypothetical protein